MTEEHAIPQWLEDLCKAQGEYQQVVDGVARPRGYKRATRTVCVDCHRWINRNFEEPVQPIVTPIVTGHVMELSPADQKIVAGWAVKVMLGQATIDYELKRVRSLTREFRRSGGPSSMAFVALGAVAPVTNADGVSWPNHPAMNEAPRDEPPYLPPDSLQQTLQVAHVVFLVIHVPRQSDARRVRETYRLHPKLVTIWPTNSDAVVWPPPAPFEEPLGEIQYLALRDWPERGKPE